MKKQLLLLVLILLPMVASADAVEINGIYYKLITKGGANDAEVTSNPNKYNGNIVIPESVTYEGTDYSVTSIGDRSFEECSGLTSVTIPNSVTSIGESAFINCSGLTSVTIPNSVTSIGIGVFSGCSRLTSITIPNSVTNINNGAFFNCYGLTSVNIPNSVTSIGGTAFAGCIGLTSVTIPNSVTYIGQYAFYECSGLTSITIPNSVKIIGAGAFQDCSCLTSITISNNISYIENRTFAGCLSLTSVTIPNSVENIWDWAFEGCSGLISVTIGSGIKKISKEVFASCPELADVYCHAINVPNTSSDVFQKSFIDYATLHVPAESVNAYRAAEPWKNFKEIVPLEGGDTPEPQKCEKPTISYKNGQLKFASATDGAEFVSEITDSDIKKNYEATVTLTATYSISVYATKTGYDNSDVATATLCWIDKEPTTEGITDGVAQIASKAVLIQSEGGTLTIQGADDGTPISIYGIDGTQKGTSVSKNGAATIITSLQSGGVAIIRIGGKSVKVVIN